MYRLANNIIQAKIMIEERSHDKINDKNDETIKTIKEKKERPYSELTGAILVGLLVNFRRRKLVRCKY
jgi:hypothetical protein